MQMYSNTTCLINHTNDLKWNKMMDVQQYDYDISSFLIYGLCVCVLPAQSDFDGRGQAGGEQVSREVRVHGQELGSFTRC